MSALTNELPAPCQVSGEIQNNGFRQILAVMATVHHRAGDIWAKVIGAVLHFKEENYNRDVASIDFTDVYAATEVDDAANIFKAKQ